MWITTNMWTSIPLPLASARLKNLQSLWHDGNSKLACLDQWKNLHCQNLALFESGFIYISLGMAKSSVDGPTYTLANDIVLYSLINCSPLDLLFFNLLMVISMALN